MKEYYLCALHFIGGVMAVLNGISLFKRREHLEEIKRLKKVIAEKDKVIQGYEQTLNRILKINGNK